MRRLIRWVGVLVLACASHAQAGVIVGGGQTSVALDLPLLSSVGLNLTGTTGPVIVPGELPGSVAFPITGATTFEYTAGTVAPFSGTIEHAGGVTFNDTLTVGDFTIGYDAARVGGARSGFFVADNIGFPGAVLFDIGSLDVTTASTTLLLAAGDLLVSSTLAGVLGNTQLTGVDVGDALVRATAVPEPGVLALLLVSGIAGVYAGRRRRTDRPR